MTKIIIESASNGVIKTIIDENANGAGDSFEEKKVYNFENDQSNDFRFTINFFSELTEDLGLFVGNEFSRHILVEHVRWGNSYKPSKEEVKLKIREYRAKIRELENKIK